MWHFFRGHCKLILKILFQKCLSKVKDKMKSKIESKTLSGEIFTWGNERHLGFELLISTLRLFFLRFDILIDLVN